MSTLPTQVYDRLVYRLLGSAQNGLLNTCSLNGRQVSRKSYASILHLRTRQGSSMNVKQNERFMKPHTHLCAKIINSYRVTYVCILSFTYRQLNAVISDGLMYLHTWITDSNDFTFYLLIYNKNAAIEYQFYFKQSFEQSYVNVKCQKLICRKFRT